MRSLNDLDALVADAKKRKSKESHDSDSNYNNDNKTTSSSAVEEATADITNGPMPYATLNLHYPPAHSTPVHFQARLLDAHAHTLRHRL